MLTRRDRAEKYKAIENLLELRRSNLRTLSLRYTSWASFARAVACEVAYLHAIAGPNPTRPVTNPMARDIETLLNLPYGWLDTPHGKEAKSSRPDRCW